MTVATLHAPGADSRPFLPRGSRVVHDPVRGRWVLLAPERMLVLDETGRAVLGETDGQRTLGEIATRLAERYDAPRERVLRDAIGFVTELWARRIVDVTP